MLDVPLLAGFGRPADGPGELVGLGGILERREDVWVRAACWELMSAQLRVCSPAPRALDAVNEVGDLGEEWVVVLELHRDDAQPAFLKSLAKPLTACLSSWSSPGRLRYSTGALYGSTRRIWYPSQYTSSSHE